MSAYSVTTIVGSTIATFGNMYLIDASSNPITITLENATGNAGSLIQFKRVDWVSSNAVTIIPDPTDGSFIDGTMTSLLVHPGDSILTFVDNTSSWLRTWVDLSRTFVFGDGSDGIVAISSNTTLTRDMYYTQLDVSGGAIVTTNGFRIFVVDRLTLTGANTTIQNNGFSGIVGGGAGAGAGGAVPGNLISTIGGGFSGAAGVTGTGTAGIQGNPSIAIPASVGGAGSSGGSAGAASGGIGGSNVPPGVCCGGMRCIRQLNNALNARDNSSAMLVGGSGGGSGASNSATATGGGGGGGGGILLICARSIVCDASESCQITCVGGAGGAASGSGSAGGGGGGGGGCVILLTRVSNVLANSPGLTVSVAGGAGGLGIGTGGNGIAGNIGNVQIIDQI